MTTTRRSIVVIAALAGVLVAGALVAGAAVLLGDRADPGSTSTPTTSPDAAAGVSSSTGRAAGSSPPETSTTTPVTVDVPRSERRPAPDLPLPASPAPAPAPAPATEPITDPQHAAGTYLVAAETVTGDDAGGRHRRAEPYMAPENPALASGLLVPEPPPAGHSRTIEVLSVTEHARNERLDRIAYRITYQRHLSPTIPATASLPDGPPRVTYVVVARQPAGNWLVLSHTNNLDPTE
jgi:hypothetical protein